MENNRKGDKVDLVAIKDGGILKIDVKTLSETSTLRVTDHEQRERGIRFLYVRLSTKEVGWNRDYFTH